MKKSKIGVLLKAASVCYVFCAAFLMFGKNGNAYIDPSVMTYVIQAVAGVVIAAGAFVGVYWRRAKKKVEKKLGVEEKKEQESDDIIIKSEDTKEE